MVYCRAEAIESAYVSMDHFFSVAKRQERRDNPVSH
jgi:hypothetical protein